MSTNTSRIWNKMKLPKLNKLWVQLSMTVILIKNKKEKLRFFNKNFGKEFKPINSSCVNKVKIHSSKMVVQMCHKSWNHSMLWIWIRKQHFTKWVKALKRIIKRNCSKLNKNWMSIIRNLKATEWSLGATTLSRKMPSSKNWHWQPCNPSMQIYHPPINQRNHHFLDNFVIRSTILKLAIQISTIYNESRTRLSEENLEYNHWTRWHSQHCGARKIVTIRVNN